MKAKALLFIVSIIAAMFASVSYAQTEIGDTILCPAATYGAAGELRKFIEGDTLANGERKNINRVYKVERGKTYWWDASSIQSYPLRIVADPENPASPSAPAIFAPWVGQDDKSAGGWINHRKGELVLKNIYFMYWRSTDKKQVEWSVPVTTSADSSRIVITNCIFDGSSGNSISYNGKWNKVYITDCYFKNGQHPTSYFGGGSIHGSGTPGDTLVVMTNTSFCNTGYFVLAHNAVHNYVRMEHNTVVLNAVNVFYDFYGANTIIRNNLVYGGNSFGATQAQVDEGWFDKDKEDPGIISTDTLSASQIAERGITDAQRSYVVEGNVYFWPQEVKQYWTDNSTIVTHTTKWM
ncbi:MAG TPA: right-handed parallel beta-helix repeat-containing protein, partial [Ignavibacteriales bacterium]|nr:right-handed parallel beta-helix repeat-containing protein [Ignavibacteriales bacterium]